MAVEGSRSVMELFIGGDGAKSVFGTASYYLASTLIFFIIIQIVNERKRLLAKWNGKQRKNSGNNNSEQEYVAGLEAIPGPSSLPLLGNALDVTPLSKTFDVIGRWSKLFGPAFKIFGPGNTPVVFLNSAPTIQALLKSSDLGHVLKMPMVYDLMKPFITNGVLVSKGKFWQHERKILLRSMSFQSLKAYIPMLNRHCQRFVDSLDKLFSDGKVHPINEEINSSFLETVTELITGFDLHDNAEGVEYHHNFQIWKESIAHRLAYPWNVPGPLWKLNPLSWKTDKAVKKLMDFARRRIYEHQRRTAEANKTQKEFGDTEKPSSENNSPPPFRSVLDELMDEGVPVDQIIDEVNTMLFGGHETGASTIHFFCLMMAMNPEIQEACRKEADEVFDNPELVTDGRLTFDSMSSLKYAERTVLETLRLFPPVFVYLRQLKTPLKIELDNKPVGLPVGTNIAIFPFDLHRKEEYYPEPEKFNPDRFLPEVAAKRHAYAYVPFSSGSRNCLGLKFAMIELKMIVAYLVRNFTIHSTDRLEDVKLLPSLTLTPERDYNFIFKRRTIS